MIVPSLRGYKPDMGATGIAIICAKCNVPYLLYRRMKPKKREPYRIPCVCLKCGTMVVMRLEKER